MEPSLPDNQSFPADMRLDLGAAIRERVKVVRSADLASRFDNLQLLNMSTLRELLKSAVNDATARLGSRLEEGLRKRCLREAEENFQKKFLAMQAAKSGLEQKVKKLQTGLGAARSALEGQHRRSASSRDLSLCEDVLVGLEKRFSRALRCAGSTGYLDQHVQGNVRRMIGRILEDERGRIQERLKRKHEDQVVLLERKVQRLAAALDGASKERERMRQELVSAWKKPVRGEGTVPIRQDGSGPDRARKISLMKEIVKLNRDLRKAIKTAGLNSLQGLAAPPVVSQLRGA